MKIIAILMLWVAYVGCQSPQCPSEEDIKPCVCKSGIDDKLEITCEGVKTAGDLKKAVASMKSLKISSLSIEKSTMDVISSYIFEDMEIEKLIILETNLTKLGEGRNIPPFIGLENSLTRLEINAAFKNPKFPLSMLSLSHLKRLTFLKLRDNIIPTIGNNWFESGPYGLTDLYLYNTQTRKLGSHAFEALENLKAFTLTGGYFSEISRDMFPMPASSLKSIDLSSNKLSILPPDIFRKMPELTDVFLEKNALTTVSEVTWAPVWSQLDHVYFYQNTITCDKNMKWIYKYRLPEYFKGHCSAPPNLSSRMFSNLTLSDFD